MSVLDILAIIIGIVILFFFGLYLFLRFAPKGVVGETIVYKTMDFTLNKEYTIFNNVMLLDGDKSVQIDHIIASRYGIFVIETKNYSGKIYGNETSSHFTQYVGRQKNTFYSPIKQNNSHIYALNKVVGKFPYTSVVIFLGQATLKVDSHVFVGSPLQASRYIKSHKSYVLTDEQLSSFIQKINELDASSYVSNREHVANVNYNLEKYETALDTMTCPWCGSKLVLRKGKYGEFYGCSSYPKCKYIHKDRK